MDNVNEELEKINGVFIGYARVSTKDQNLNRQIDALKKFGCRIIFQEKCSGKNAERKELKKMIEYTQSGDTIIVTSLSRLARSVKDLMIIIEELKEKKVGLKSLKEEWLDTTTPHGKLLLTMFGGLAEFEREMITERTKEGLASAKARGQKFGRPKIKSKNIKRALMLYDVGVPVADIIQMVGISKATLYNYLKKRREGEI